MSNLYIYEVKDLHDPKYTEFIFYEGEIIKQDEEAYLIAFNGRLDINYE